MGNTVSAAEIVASELNKNSKSQAAAKFDHKDVFSGQEIPPECPMHVKQTPVATECPIKHDDVNPLNMVIIEILPETSCPLMSLSSFLDAGRQSKACARTTLSPAH